MLELLESILKVPVVAGIFRFVRCLRFPVLCGAGLQHSAGELFEQPDLRVLNCRVQLTKQKDGDCVSDVFIVEVCGSICAPGDMHYTRVEIFIGDITEGHGESKAVHSSIKKWQMANSPAFCYSAELGRLPKARSTLLDWVTVAQINPDWLMFAHKGERILRFDVSILSGESGEELACASCSFIYENCRFGYLEMGENVQRARTLAVALAFAVSAAGKVPSDCEVAVIRDWAGSKIDRFCLASGGGGRKLDKALSEAVSFFSGGNQIDIYKICKDIVNMVPVAERYEILELCLRAAGADGVADVEEMTVLKMLASWLEVDGNKFRAMMSKILPVSMHEVEDIEAVLGITSDMSEEEVREHLNKEYRKWNARVNNCDPAIQSQASYMLNFIAETRESYVA